MNDQRESPDELALGRASEGIKTLREGAKRCAKASSIALDVAKYSDGRGGRGGSLGISTVIAANPRGVQTLETLDPHTGELCLLTRDREGFSQAYDADAAHMQRWLMLKQAQLILSSGDSAFEMRDKTQRAEYCVFDPDFVGARNPFGEATRYVLEDRLDGAGERVQRLEPVFRTVNCLGRRVPGMDAEVWQSRKTEQASWHNLTVCGSPWACPVCSRRINLGRQDQIRRTYQAAKDQAGGSVYMLTFTVKHGVGDDCRQLVARMKDAMWHLQKSPAFKQATRKAALKRPQAGSLPFLDYIGRISALEATHGLNGWHPHEHQLWFFRRRLSVSEVDGLRRCLFEAWRVACVAAGLGSPAEFWTDRSGLEHQLGLDVREAFSAEEYLTKFSDLDHARRWGPEKELASSHVKSGKRKGRTPMQILWDSSEVERPYHAQGNLLSWNKDAVLFLEFATAFKGRHQLQFSRTLKKWLKSLGIDIDETAKGDQELAQSVESESEFLFELGADEWSRVVRNRAQGNVLGICKASGVAAALEYIRGLPGGVSGVDCEPWADLSEMRKRAHGLRGFDSRLGRVVSSVERVQLMSSYVPLQSDSG